MTDQFSKLSPEERRDRGTTAGSALELIDYLKGQIDKLYEEHRPKIERLFAEERLASEEGRSRDWLRIRDQRSAAIYDLERAAEPMKQQIIAIAEAIEAANPRPLVFSVSSAKPAAVTNPGSTKE